VAELRTEGQGTATPPERGSSGDRFKSSHLAFQYISACFVAGTARMVFGMASVKVTVTVPEQQLRAMRDLVALGQAASVSGFVQHAIDVALDDVAGWQQTLDEALTASGGPLSVEERTWADQVLTSAARPVA
jgi:Arc/MetJ-type ribon-helix-helix transcriptional regulator